jgi:hypothetical protein
MKLNLGPMLQQLLRWHLLQPPRAMCCSDSYYKAVIHSLQPAAALCVILIWVLPRLLLPLL